MVKNTSQSATSQELAGDIGNNRASVGLWEWDVATRTIIWSSGMYAIHEIEPQRLPQGLEKRIELSLHCYDLEERPKIEALVDRCREHGEAYDLECGFTTLRGRRLWVRTTGHALIENGKVGKIVGCLLDLTKERQASAKIDDEGIRRRALMAASRDGIAIIDQEHRVVEANARFAAMLGYPEGEVIGLRTWDFEAMDSEEQIRYAFRDLTLTNAVFETKHRRRDGSVYDAEVSASGTLVGGRPMVLTISRDISERKRAESSLRQSEEKFRLAFDTAPDPAVITRLWDGCFVDVNRAFVEHTGHTREEVMGRTSLDFGFWANPEDRRRLYDNLHAHGQVRGMETVLLRGREFPVAVLVSAAVFDLEGAPHIYFSARSLAQQKAAETELRASEARYRQILQTTMDGFCRVDRQGRIVEVNQAYCRMSGYAVEELLAKSVHDMDAVMDEPTIARHLQHLEEKGVDRFETRQRRKDGSIFEVEVSVQLRTTQSGEVEFVSFLRDISVAKRGEWIFQQLQKLGLDLSHAATVEETLRLALAAALRISDLDCGGVYLVDAESSHLVLAVHQGMPPDLAARVASIPAQDPRMALVMQGRAAYLEAAQFAGLDPGLQQTLNALAIIPIVSQQRVVACLNLGSFSHATIPESARSPIESLAGQLGGYVTRALLEENLRESRARYSTLFDHTPVAVWEQDLSAVKAMLDDCKARGIDDIYGYFASHPDVLRRCLLSVKILKVNRESAVIFKCARAEKLQHNLLGYFDHESMMVFAQAFAELGRGRSAIHSELPVLDLRDKRRHLLARLAICPGHERDLSRVLVSFLDITEEKRAAALLLQSNRKLQAISECRQALLRHDDEEHLLMEICRIICEKAMHAMAWVAFADGRGKLSVRVAASHGVKDAYLDKAREVFDHHPWEASPAPLHQALAHGAIVVVDDFEKYATSPALRELALARGYRSSVYLPLKDEQGKVFGALNIYSRGAHTFTAAELELLLALANDLAYGIGFLRLRLAQQRNHQVNKARIDLIDYAQNHSLAELLEATLNNAEQLTSSCIGFYHFVNEAEKTLSLQAWSTRTKREFCTADDTSRQYEIASAGVWVDCFHSRQPVIHNDYNSLEHRKGMPEGHAEVRRLLSVPVMRGEEIVAILAVGNKATGYYTTQDVEIVALLADLAWEIAEKKREEARREAVESQLRQAQKMEAIGTLAGGIAHDFNNILGAIVGYGEMALEDAQSGTVNPGDLRQVLNAADRAKALVRQILTFSRKVEVDYKPLNLSRQVEQAITLLGKTLPKMVSLQTHLPCEVWPISGDANQIEQIVFNLTVNAADAMNGQGVITITTANSVVKEQTCLTCGKVFSGPYVTLEVVDSGMGMDEETRKHIFEPFYTTKEVGKGTGLGLSTVYGIVIGHGAHVICQSMPGEGTRFLIYFPVLCDDDSSEVFTVSSDDGFHSDRAELVLVVDDEEPLRNIATRQLQRAGYRTLTADCGEEALRVYGVYGSLIDLILLDLSMPGQGGYKALQQLLRLDPLVKVIIASGYAAAGQVTDSLEIGAAAYIAKPLNHKQLLATVRRVLDGDKI